MRTSMQVEDMRNTLRLVVPSLTSTQFDQFVEMCVHYSRASKREKSTENIRIELLGNRDVIMGKLTALGMKVSPTQKTFVAPIRKVQLGKLRDYMKLGGTDIRVRVLSE